jgi:hypothetical protein
VLAQRELAFEKADNGPASLAYSLHRSDDMGNIEPYVEPFFCKSMQGVMFCAHDEAEHTVRWSDAADAYIVENKHVGLVRTTDSLGCALQTVGNYLGIGLEDFTICSQP